jgi:hypothetical protein
MLRTLGNDQQNRGDAAHNVEHHRTHEAGMTPSDSDDEIIITVPADMQAGVWANWGAINESDHAFLESRSSGGR